jgi:hypothetical protein
MDLVCREETQSKMEPQERPPRGDINTAPPPPSPPASVPLRAMEFNAVLTKGACGFGIYFTAAADSAAIVDPTTPFYRLPDDTPAPGEASGVIEPRDRLLAINGISVEQWRFPAVVDELRRTPQGDAILRFRRMAADAGADHNHDDCAAMVPPPARVIEAYSETDAARESDPLAASLVRHDPKRVRWKLFDWPTVGPANSAASDHSAESTHGDVMNRSAAMEELLVDMENRLRELEDAVEREKKCRFLAEKKNILYRNALCTLSDENAQLRHALAAETHARETSRRFQQQKLQLSI